MTDYEKVFPLGEGGMGVVWLARARGGEGDPVAIKTLRPELASDARVRSMFLKEIRLASAIRHPNVVSVLATGEEQGAPYFVMEWVHGRSLRALAPACAERGGIPLAVALRIVLDACAGLHAAHEARGDGGAPLGLVHRDVTHHNLVVSRSGLTKVIDFGVAKARELRSGETTTTGGVKGKVRYMAPEQALARPLDRRADVFALGAVLHELVVGRSPFEGPNDLAILRALLATRAVEIPPTVPAPLADVLVRALARRPDDRFATCDEMGAALVRAAHELGLGADHAAVARWLEGVAPDLASDVQLAAARLPAGSPHADPTIVDEIPIAVTTSLLPAPPAAVGARARVALVGAALGVVAMVAAAAMIARVPAARASGEAPRAASTAHVTGAAVPATRGASEVSPAIVAMPVETTPSPKPPTARPAPAAQAQTTAAPVNGARASGRPALTVKRVATRASDPYADEPATDDLEKALRERH